MHNAVMPPAGDEITGTVVSADDVPPAVPARPQAAPRPGALRLLWAVPLMVAGVALGGCTTLNHVINGATCAVQMKGKDVQVQLLHAGNCAIPVDKAATWAQAPNRAQPGNPGAVTGKPMSVICTLVKQDSTVIILDAAGSGLGRRLCKDAERGGFQP